MAVRYPGGWRRHVLLAAAASAACAADDAKETPGSCDGQRGLFEVAPVASDPLDPCHPWVRAVYGRAVRVDAGSFGSASVWSSSTEYGAAVLTTAGHVMSPCDAYFSDLNDNGVFGGECPAALLDPTASKGQTRIRMSQMGGGPSSAQWSAHFPLFHPAITMDEVRNSSVPPGRDFAVYVVDGQLFEPWPGSVETIPGPVQPTLPPLFDPDGLTGAAPSWSEAIPDEEVILVGYPERPGNPAGRLLHASAGTVLSDEEAEAAIAVLEAAGDIEGSLPYVAHAELIVEASATYGMSGSGVFNSSGAQIGVVVRASFADVGRQFVRAVRMSHIVAELEAAAAIAPAAARQAVEPFFPPL